LVTCVVVVLVVGFAPPAGAAVTRSCGLISFTPNSDDGAFSIRARGVGCVTARRVARAVRPLKIVDGPRRYRSNGFVCRGRLDDTSLAMVRWRCARGAAVVTFNRS